MSGSVRITSVTTAIGTTPIVALVGLTGSSGPDTMRINWDSTGPDGTLPQVETYLPDGNLEFDMPAGERPYADGSYLIRVAIDTAGIVTGAGVALFLDNNGTVAQEKAGGGRIDLMMGGSGHDSFRGGAADDWLGGGLGDDLLNGGLGNDTLFGGEGDDTLLGGEDNDLMNGGLGQDLRRGGAGEDSMAGDAGNDTLYGDDGIDTLDGGFGDDRLFAGAQDDILFGREGDDRPVAGAGLDTLQGGLGVDRLVGDEGLDITDFYYESAAEGRDVISNFTSGVDLISLMFITMDQMDPARFVGDFAEVSAPGPWVIFEASSSNLYVDLHGDAPGQIFHIARLAGVASLAYDDLRFDPGSGGGG
jgi:Ca2+-binding RTX toxin-like protein